MIRARDSRLVNSALTIALPAFALALGVSLSVPKVQAADTEPCTIATKGDSPVVKACQEGGIPKAKRAMKEMVRNAKAKGMKLECTDCHTAIDEWKLNQGATDKFRKMLELTK